MHDEKASPVLTSVTSTHLLEGLRKPDNQTVWQQFDARYRPVIRGYARRAGLSEQDAEDAAQKTLLEFSESYRKGKYDRQKGRLRHWLFGIARNQIRNTIRRLPAREHHIAQDSRQTDFFARISDQQQEDQLEALEEKEWRAGVLRQCLVEVRQTFDTGTVQAFELFAGQDWPAKRVAEHLGMTENAVYLAKHKILKRIRELTPHMEEIW